MERDLTGLKTKYKNLKAHRKDLITSLAGQERIGEMSLAELSEEEDEEVDLRKYENKSYKEDFFDVSFNSDVIILLKLMNVFLFSWPLDFLNSFNIIQNSC